ncbi:hypothetical protein V6N13_131881 [Hibiscus sabdariffa]|uniref:Uncharacterized protein n=1 Tax=Hibiscus sabdariffa TaxID=183260 RepID=A0ABR2D9A3_9ROSI
MFGPSEKKGEIERKNDFGLCLEEKEVRESDIFLEKQNKEKTKLDYRIEDGDGGGFENNKLKGGGGEKMDLKHEISMENEDSQKIGCLDDEKDKVSQKIMENEGKYDVGGEEEDSPLPKYLR